MTNTAVPTMLTIKETAERTNLSQTYIRRLCWDNKITYVKSGSKYYVNLEKLCDYLNQKN